jgi:hypothetical protein
MATDLFHLQITGAISSDENETEAIAALANILVVPLSQAQLLFSHAPVVVKENIDHDTAVSIESQLQKHGIECKRLLAAEYAAQASESPEGLSIHDKLMDASQLENVDLSGLSLVDDWTPDSSDHHEERPVEDVHTASHHAVGDLSAYHLDELGLEAVTPEFEKPTEARQPEETYNGPERRKDQRRKHDRREMFRFEEKDKTEAKEKSKPDRRQGDRRKAGPVWSKRYDI